MDIILVLAALIFGLLAVASLTCLLLARSKPRSTPSDNAIRLYKPCKQRRESLKRATFNARLLVAGGSIDIPQRRRA